MYRQCTGVDGTEDPVVETCPGVRSERRVTEVLVVVEGSGDGGTCPGLGGGDREVLGTTSEEVSGQRLGTEYPRS